MQRPDWVDSGLYPFQDHWAGVEGCSVDYVDEGSEPPLLMLAGNPTWSFTWRDVIRRRNFFVEKIIPGGMKRVGPDERVMEHYRRPFPTPRSRVPMAALTEWASSRV